MASDGTPWVDEHLAPEYAALRGTPIGTATELIVDALDLRHRFPKLWRAVHDLQVEVWTARKISKACRDLTAAAAAKVDAELAKKAAWGLPWGRLHKILTAAIWNADPALAQRKLDRARFDRRVWLSDSEDGLRTMVIPASTSCNPITADRWPDVKSSAAGALPRCSMHQAWRRESSTNGRRSPTASSSQGIR